MTIDFDSIPESQWGDAISDSLWEDWCSPSETCLVCGVTRADVETVQIVPQELAGCYTADPDNHQSLCSDCLDDWQHASIVKQVLAAVMLRQFSIPKTYTGWMPPTLYDTFDGLLGDIGDVKAIELPMSIFLERDAVCRVCLNPTAPAQQHKNILNRADRGHIVSRRDGRDWLIPETYLHHSANLVLMCMTCNQQVFRSDTPSLADGLPYLVKPWTFHPPPSSREAEFNALVYDNGRQWCYETFGYVPSNYYDMQ